MRGLALNTCRNGGAERFGRTLPAQVACAHRSIGQGIRNRHLQRLGSIRHSVGTAAPAHPVQQHRDRYHQGRRIGFVLTGNIGGRAVRSLRNCDCITGIDRTTKAKAAGQFCAFIRQNIAVHVGRDQHIEVRRTADQMRGRRIDDQLFDFDAGAVGSDLHNLFEEQAIRNF